MYLQPWQIFLLGCIVGTIISFILLSVMLIRALERAGLRPTGNADTKTVDLIAKLNYVLLTKGLITQSDTEFMLDKISFDEWKSRSNTNKSDEENSNGSN